MSHRVGKLEKIAILNLTLAQSLWEHNLDYSLVAESPQHEEDKFSVQFIFSEQFSANNKHPLWLKKILV